MPTHREWAAGYLAQARADMKAARQVQALEPSVLAMLLQMVLEKLGKAALLRGGFMRVGSAQRTHAAAPRMVQTLARDPRACGQVGWKGWAPNKLRFQVAPIVQELEAAQPALAKGRPCLEYPWEDSTGTVCWPAKDLPVLRHFQPQGGLSGGMVYRFTIDLSDKFDSVFP